MLLLTFGTLHSIQVRLPSNRAKLASREVDERMKSMRVTTVPQDFGLENEDWLVMPMQRCLETNCLKPRGINAITCSAPINTQYTRLTASCSVYGHVFLNRFLYVESPEIRVDYFQLFIYSCMFLCYIYVYLLDHFFSYFGAVFPHPSPMSCSTSVFLHLQVCS